MTADPYTPRRIGLTAADRAAWRSYERGGARAAEHYTAQPLSAFGGGRPTVACTRCSGRTYEPAGLCWACRREVAK